MSASWEDEYLTVKEIAEHLRLNQQTVRTGSIRGSCRRSGSAGAFASGAPTSTANSPKVRRSPPSLRSQKPDRVSRERN